MLLENEALPSAGSMIIDFSLVLASGPDSWQSTCCNRSGESFIPKTQPGESQSARPPQGRPLAPEVRRSMTSSPPVLPPPVAPASRQARAVLGIVADGLECFEAGLDLPDIAKRHLDALDRRLNRWCPTRSPLGMIRVILRRRRMRAGIFRRYAPYSPGLHGLFGVDPGA